jgi:hypothetical protein
MRRGPANGLATLIADRKASSLEDFDISALIAHLVRAAALKRIPLHGLRHTYARLALSKGVNPAIVSRRLGHSTVAFTLDVYSHVLPQVDAEAAEWAPGGGPLALYEPEHETPGGRLGTNEVLKPGYDWQELRPRPLAGRVAELLRAPPR